MTKIMGTYYLDLRNANDNALVMVPKWDGMKFLGYAVQKPAKPMPLVYEVFPI